MTYLSTTDLRTKSSQLINYLAAGKSVGLLHRSKLVGEIKPVDEMNKVLNVQDIKEMNELIKKIRPKKLIPIGKREEVYRKNLMKKYGQSIS